METAKITRKTQEPRPLEDIAADLRHAAQDNSLLGIVLKKFTTRVRNRNVLTPGALKLALTKDNLNFPKSQYADILKLMSEVGLGKLELGPRGQIRGLHRIPYDLKEIGEVALGTKKQKQAIDKAETVIKKETLAEDESDKAETTSQEAYAVQLIIRHGGRTSVYPDTPMALEFQEMVSFLSKFESICRRVDQ